MKIAFARLVVTATALSSAVWFGFGISLATAQSSEESNQNRSVIEQQIVAKEREGLEALRTGDLTHFGDLTAEDAVFVDAQGPATKAEVLKHVVGFRITEYSMDNTEFRAISANTGLVTYKLTEKGVSHGKEFAAQAYVSSIWTERNGKWVCLFSQETAAR